LAASYRERPNLASWGAAQGSSRRGRVCCGVAASSLPLSHRPRSLVAGDAGVPGGDDEPPSTVYRSSGTRGCWAVTRGGRRGSRGRTRRRPAAP